MDFYYTIELTLLIEQETRRNGSTLPLLLKPNLIFIIINITFFIFNRDTKYIVKTYLIVISIAKYKTVSKL